MEAAANEMEQVGLKKLRVSSSFREDDEEHRKKQKTRGDFHGHLGNLESNKVAVEWSSLEMMTQQKLHTSGTEDVKKGATEVGKLFHLKDKGSRAQQEAHAPSAKDVPSIISVIVPEKRKTFPEMLHELLVKEEVQETICWLPDGNAFVIKSRDKLVNEVFPKYFKEAKYDSFTRKLNRWGFRRASTSESNPVYHHRLFKRDEVDLCKGMRGAPKTEQNASETPTSTSEPLPNPFTESLIMGRDGRVHTGSLPPLSPLVLPYFQPGPMSLERRTIACATAENYIQEERMVARAIQMQALTGELEFRNHAFGLPHFPLQDPIMQASVGALLGYHPRESGTTPDISFGTPHSLASVAVEPDLMSALLLRRGPLRKEVNRRMFRSFLSEM